MESLAHLLMALTWTVSEFEKISCSQLVSLGVGKRLWVLGFYPLIHNFLYVVLYAPAIQSHRVLAEDSF